MLRVIEYFAKSLEVIRNDTLEKGVGPKSLLVLHCNYRPIYLARFLRYSALNNGVTVKFWVGVVQDH